MLFKRRTKKTLIKSTDDRKRLSVFKSNTAVYAQIIDDSTGQTIVSASSMKDKSKTLVASTSVGSAIAKLAKEKGIQKVIFDRGSYVYKGKVKAIAEAARAAGLEF